MLHLPVSRDITFVEFLHRVDAHTYFQVNCVVPLGKCRLSNYSTQHVFCLACTQRRVSSTIAYILSVQRPLFVSTAVSVTEAFKPVEVVFVVVKT